MEKEHKSRFEILDIASAPNESKPILEKSVNDFGYIPNLHGVLAVSPNLLEAYKTLHKLFSNSSFNKEEITVVWQTINVEHECHYCVPAHTAIANAMKVNREITNALRSKMEMPTAQLQVLHETTLSIVRNRGLISDAEIKRFIDAGYTKRQLLEIILGLSQKVISNYVNHIATTPLDKKFKRYYWEAN